MITRVGIVSAAGYVPRYRLSGKTFAQVWGGGGTGERAVANYDEDAVTMACEAALGDGDPAPVGVEHERRGDLATGMTNEAGARVGDVHGGRRGWNGRRSGEGRK